MTRCRKRKWVGPLVRLCGLHRSIIKIERQGAVLSINIMQVHVLGDGHVVL